MSTKCSSGAVLGGVLPNPSLLPTKPSEAGSPGRGGAREQTQFSPLGGNGVEWTLRRRAAMGKVGRRPQAAKPPLRETEPVYYRPLIRPLRGHLPPCGGKAYGRPKAAPTEWGTLRGGRVRTPAPARIQGRPRFPRRGRSQTGPRAHTVRPYGGKRTGGAGPGPEKKSGAPVKNTGAPGQKQVKHTPPCCRFRPSGR